MNNEVIKYKHPFLLIGNWVLFEFFVNGSSNTFLHRLILLLDFPNILVDKSRRTHHCTTLFANGCGDEKAVVPAFDRLYNAFLRERMFDLRSLTPRYRSAITQIFRLFSALRTKVYFRLCHRFSPDLCDYIAT